MQYNDLNDLGELIFFCRNVYICIFKRTLYWKNANHYVIYQICTQFQIGMTTMHLSE